jgi:hypothetical protein
MFTKRFDKHDFMQWQDHQHNDVRITRTENEINRRPLVKGDGLK